MQKYVLTIDQGTGSTRIIIYNQKLEKISVKQKELSQIYVESAGVEQDALQIWQDVLELLQQSLDENKIKPEQIATIGITNQRETTVVWDKQTGLPIHNALVWQSRQSQQICETLIAKERQESYQAKTGLKIDPYFSATKIRWILDHVAGAQSRAENGELLAGTIDTWLLWNLTNGAKHLTDYSNASRTMLFNIHELKWDEDILSDLNIPKKLLGQVVDSSYDFGIVDYKYFNCDIPITGMAGDQQAALFGQKCSEVGMVKNTYGTGCFMLMNTGTKAIKSEKGLLTTIAWGINGEVTYALEGSVFVAGNAIKWLRDSLKIIDSAAESEVKALMSNDEDLVVVPAFVGLGTPYWNPNVRGAMYGITQATKDIDIVKATLRAICFQVKDVLDVFEAESAVKIKKLKVDGGASRNDFLLQFQADIMDVSVKRATDVETTSLGVAMLAGLYLNYWQSLSEIHDLITADAEFNGRLSREERKKLCSNWQAAIKATELFSNSKKN